MKRLFKTAALMVAAFCALNSSPAKAGVVIMGGGNPGLFVPMLIFTPAGGIICATSFYSPAIGIWLFLDADAQNEAKLDSKMKAASRPEMAKVDVRKDLNAKVKAGILTRTQANKIYKELTALVKAGAFSKPVPVQANTVGEYLKGIQEEAGTSDETTVYVASLMGLTEDQINEENDASDLFF